MINRGRSLSLFLCTDLVELMPVLKDAFLKDFTFRNFAFKDLVQGIERHAICCSCELNLFC